jgi:Putative beta barrel porin-7 (BBP7)
VVRVDYRTTETSSRVIRLKGDSIDGPSSLPPVGQDVISNYWGSYSAASATPSGEIVASIPHISGPAEPPNSCFYGSAEYLLWWTQGQRVPPLLTTGTAASNGILGAPGTVVLYGGDTIGTGARSGGRFTLGFWMDDEKNTAVEGTFLFLAQRSFSFAANSSMYPLLARPFFNLNTGTEFREAATTPGVSVGQVAFDNPSRLWGAELNLRCNLCCGCWGRLDLIGGFRYLELDEAINITESLIALPGSSFPSGSNIVVSDRFGTRNQFYGAQTGLDYEISRGRWSLDLRGKLALGETHQDVNIGGNQVIVTPNGAVTTANGGLLALASNSGHFVRDRFAVMPELGVTLGYQVKDWCRLTLGYNFLYWSSVVRPGDQIDRVIDVSQIPNSGLNTPSTGFARPTATVRDTGFWAQGINFGVEFRY